MDEPIIYRPASYYEVPLDLNGRINFGEIDEYEEPRDLEDRLDFALGDDQIDEFMRLIKDSEFHQLRHRFKASRIISSNALQIGTAVLNGETKGIIDIQDELVDGMTPLHLAAANTAPRLINYLVQRGDDVDAICDDKIFDLQQATPLDLALESITRFYGKWMPWTPHKSIFELLVYVCLSERRCLESVRLLVQNTQNKDLVRQAFINYADKGKFVQLAALFLAAPEVFLSPYFVSSNGGLSSFGVLYLVLNSLEKRTDIEEGLSLLLEVFTVVGDKLVAFIRLEDPNVRGLNIYHQELRIAFLLREVAHKNPGLSSPEDCILRFFKPVRPEIDQQTSPPLRYQAERLRMMSVPDAILCFNLRRNDINIDYINRWYPSLEPVETAILDGAIENKLSSMLTLHDLFETNAYISMKRGKHMPQWFPFLSVRKFEQSLRSFPINYASAKPWFDFKLPRRNNLVNQVTRVKVKSFFSLVKPYFPMIVKRLIK